MRRAPLLAALADYGRRHPEEAATTARFRAFVAATPDCFERTHLAGHVTGSAWVVDSGRTRVLLTHHRKLDLWVQLGGHSDGDPDTRAVALREAREESGIATLEPLLDGIFDLDIHAIPARGAEPAHLHHDVRYVFGCTGDDAFVVSDESHALAWVPVDRIADVTTEPSMLRMAHKWWLLRAASGV